MLVFFQIQKKVPLSQHSVITEVFASNAALGFNQSRGTLPWLARVPSYRLCLPLPLCNRNSLLLDVLFHIQLARETLACLRN